MISCDAIVIGAGPAGAEAALTARSCDLNVVVIDEASDAGGQIYRSGPAAGVREGDLLRERLNGSGIRTLFQHRVWTAASTGTDFEVAAAGPNGSCIVQTKAIIIATGAIERFYPRPGWTLPGVLGLGAATIMLKAQGVLPGQRVLVAGPGPLAALVAHLVQKHGGMVVALIDPHPRSTWLRALPRMASRLYLLADGARWIGQLMVRRVPVLHGWDVRSFQGRDSVESVTVSPVGAPHHGRTFDVDAACFGYGLFPSTEFYRLLHADIRYAPERGGWTPVLDSHQRTTAAHVYAAGDGAEILGVSAAPLSGRMAALAAAFDLQKISVADYERRINKEQAALRRVVSFGREVARIIQPRASAMKDVPDDTIVCRCEDITVHELHSAMKQGSREINALKAATRCGMGPCGGRMCGEAVAAVMECAGVPRESIGCWTARPPLRPIPIEAITGTFEYSDIPFREPSPL